MKKKPIIVFGSSRSQGNTRRAIDAMDPQGAMELVDLRTLKITPFDYEHQNKDDDYIPLMEKILEHGPLVLASPVYWYTLSTQMKTFIDRLSDCITIRKDLGRALAGKPVFVLGSFSTTKPQHFHLPISLTCTYMDVAYQDCFLHYAGQNPALLKDNENIQAFGQRILDL